MSNISNNEQSGVVSQPQRGFKFVFSQFTDNIVNVILFIGLLVTILFVSNFILHRYFHFHLLTEHWYVFDRKADSFIVKEIPIIKIN